LRVFQSSIAACEVINLPRLHAKVYIADERCALVASANLTQSGLDSNFEYGVDITDVNAVRQVRQDIERYASLGNPLAAQNVQELEALAKELKAEFDDLERSQEKNIRRRFDRKLKATNIEFLRAQIGSRSAHGLFADAIVYLLSRGPLSTRELHPRLRDLLPELCDDTRNLVIDGRAFGKKWKHVVRTAQVFLRRTGTIRLVGTEWRLNV
jgi:hypothetical protein